jgi:hypothetical protein
MARKYEWIMYPQMNGIPGGHTSVTRVRSIDEAKSELETFSRETYHDDVSATLYAYSDEAWAEAEDFRNVGCPFDYPDRLIERGARGGLKVSRT